MNSNQQTGTYYAIRIREKLDEHWREWFDGMSMKSDADGTLIAGVLPDQAALHGVIAKVYSLGLQLVAINQLEEPGA